MKLTNSNISQISLFDENFEEKNNLSKTWDKLEDKFGKGILKLGLGEK